MERNVSDKYFTPKKRVSRQVLVWVRVPKADPYLDVSAECQKSYTLCSSWVAHLLLSLTAISRKRTPFSQPLTIPQEQYGGTAKCRCQCRKNCGRLVCSNSSVHLIRKQRQTSTHDHSYKFKRSESRSGEEGIRSYHVASQVTVRFVRCEADEYQWEERDWPRSRNGRRDCPGKPPEINR